MINPGVTFSFRVCPEVNLSGNLIFLALVSNSEAILKQNT